jgi:hypothetical protein
MLNQGQAIRAGRTAMHFLQASRAVFMAEMLTSGR